MCVPDNVLSENPTEIHDDTILQRSVFDWIYPLRDRMRVDRKNRQLAVLPMNTQAKTRQVVMQWLTRILISHGWNSFGAIFVALEFLFDGMDERDNEDNILSV